MVRIQISNDFSTHNVDKENSQINNLILAFRHFPTNIIGPKPVWSKKENLL